MKVVADTKILVVDDEEKLRDIIVEDLQFEGYQVVSASGLHEAMDYVSKGDIDLVLSDIRMQDGSGMSLLKNIKDRDQNHPVVVFMSGFADISEDEAIKKGVKSLLHKPIKYETLISTVQNALKK